MTTDYAKGVAVKTLNSGPAAGVDRGAPPSRPRRAARTSSASTWAARARTSRVVRDGRAAADAARSTSSGACRSASRRIDVVSIGAGGGSIAWLDPAGYPRSGPQSAGADPGPACYGKGGDRADQHRRPARARAASATTSSSRGACSSTSSARPRRCGARIAEPLGLEPRGRGRGRAPDRERQHGQGDPPRDRGARLRPARVRARRVRRRGPAARRRPGARAADARGDRAAVPGRDERDGPAVRRPARRLLLGLRPPSATRSTSPTSARIYAEMDERVVGNLDAPGRRARRDRGRARRRHPLRRPAALGHGAAAGDQPSGLRARPSRASTTSTCASTATRHPELAGRDLDAARRRRVARATKPDLSAIRTPARTGAGAAARERQVHFDGPGWVDDAGARPRRPRAPATRSTGPCIVEELDTTVVLPPGTSADVDAVGQHRDHAPPRAEGSR